MEKKKGIRLVGMYEKLSEVFSGSRAAIPWGIDAKEKDELRKQGKASAAKKKQRRMVQESRKKNR